MKSVAIAFALFLSSTLAIAGSLDQRSWKSINNDPSLTVQWPTVSFPGSSVPVSHVCVKADMLYTTAPVKVCTKLSTVRYACVRVRDTESCRKLDANHSARRGEYVKTQSSCAAYESQVLMTHPTHTTVRCLEYRENAREASSCVRSETVTVSYPLEYDIQVKSAPVRGESRVVGSKHYTIEACN